MKLVKALSSVIVAGLLLYALNRPWGPVPALGSFLSPFTGFWQNWEKPYKTGEEIVLSLDSLRDEVTIRFDDTGVPHIFAKNNFDLFYAQGYVTAKDRLWQMDLQTRAASGRLSEVLGPATLDMDRQSRLLGMGYGAEANIKLAMTDPRTREALLGYTAGVNAYIRQLAPQDFPVEYKLLGYQPEPWKPINTMYMLEQMTLTLAGRSNDLNMSNILKKYGKEVVDQLFPDYPMLRESPVIPEGTAWDFKRLPLPVQPPVMPVNDSIKTAHTLMNPMPAREPKVEGIGSNNWAISAQKSITGYPILANDPHLELTLPSIWYQVQLHSPDMNVYGVSLPGIPSVIIGFNQHVAWGVTNVDADVYDIYEVTFQDSSKIRYLHNNQWKPAKTREEIIYVKGREQPLKEKVIYTHHGPVYQQKDSADVLHNYAVRWIGHEPGNSFITFYELNQAKDYEDYRKALSHYVGPAQNFIFADNGKNIAITVNGKFPLKYKDQGKYVLDGSNPMDDWQGWIPSDQNPFVKNPARGFVSSANQSSTDPSYPYYLNWVFAPSERAIRINERLTAMSGANADSLRLLQNDNFSVLARTILPRLLSYLKNHPLTPFQKAGEITLSDWNYQNSPESVAASIFETWMPILGEAIWRDEFYSEKTPLDYPSRDRTLYLLLKEPDSKWFDNISTPQKETMPDIILSSFRTTLDTLTSRHGPMSPEWQWAKVKGTEIRHLSRQLKPFNAPKLKTGGGGSIVNAITRRNGPSWRMVVELGPSPRAFGIYPGGQSGNPGSPYYLNLLPKWEKGELNELLYLSSPDQQNARLTSSMILKKN
ncbi:Acyl-homoserine lactone acylase QuiP [Dyadobacter sp. CECT 9275]|uniref:Acyl-homoserine lactone acylase QuiP n=1 Tax=Dyadobacter helix TaxID=2822344 RepID=A0A916JEI5_9BACT|nr:penicillin acylase family protein [Dyadobacter sp. CECT 9275]CAG5009388.1 Acyl-homoserine lactone acylase QuiP [Dyadobacter sp. CECT 9275]